MRLLTVLRGEKKELYLARYQWDIFWLHKNYKEEVGEKEERKKKKEKKEVKKK